MELAEDYRAVAEIVYSFAEGMDLRDWALYRSVFTPTIELDYSFFHPDQKGPSTADDWAANVELRLTRLDGTQHAMTNPRTTITGDRAECDMYVHAQHVAAVAGSPAWCVVAGQYTFGLARTDGRWLIDSVALRPLLTMGDERVLAIARD